LDKDKELDLATAQKIFGYFDKSQLINLFQFIFEGKETEVLNNYREIYNQGVEPKIFINDFLELLYYFKNIESLNIDGTNFSLNDEEFNKIKKISENVNNKKIEEISSKYVVGCDGANSTTREQIKAKFQNLGFTQKWAVVDLILKKDKKNIEVVLLTANNDIRELIKQEKIFKVKNIIVNNHEKFLYLKNFFNKKKINIYNNFNYIDKIFNKKKN